MGEVRVDLVAGLVVVIIGVFCATYLMQSRPNGKPAWC
jgi:hypothetical protein